MVIDQRIVNILNMSQVYYLAAMGQLCDAEDGMGTNAMSDLNRGNKLDDLKYTSTP